MAEDAKIPPRAVRDPEHLRRVVADLMKLDEKIRFQQLALYCPYAKQQAFHDAGSLYRERLFRAGNRLGKTRAGAAELAMHLTGLYPDWWLGRRWDRPIMAWAAGITGTSTRDVIQSELFGEAGVTELRGSGMVPKHLVKWDEISTARGVTDLYDKISVKHVSGGPSVLHLKTFEQGRKKWQGKSLDCVWYDEEPDEDIYNEGTARIGDRAGMEYVTFTPLEGMSAVVLKFMQEQSPYRTEIVMTIDEVLHFTPEQKAITIAGYSEYEREARTNGTPFMGDGVIFMTPEAKIKEPIPDPLPRHWFYVWGLDFGGVSDRSHPWAAVLLGHDRDANTVYILAALREAGLRIYDEVKLIKDIMPDAPVAWPQDGTAHEKTSGETLSGTYKKEGLNMLGEHATHPDGGLSTEAAIREMDEAMKGGKFKIAGHLEKLFEEYRTYHRKEGLIVKKKDDIMSAMRIAWMMRRKAKQVDSLDPWKRANAGGGRKILQAQTDFNPYTGA